LDGDPPSGPAIPVTDTARSAAVLSRRPLAIATGDLRRDARRARQDLIGHADRLALEVI
jgi:hypothetical protein